MEVYCYNKGQQILFQNEVVETFLLNNLQYLRVL